MRCWLRNFQLIRLVCAAFDGRESGSIFQCFCILSRLADYFFHIEFDEDLSLSPVETINSHVIVDCTILCVQCMNSDWQNVQTSIWTKQMPQFVTLVCQINNSESQIGQRLAIQTTTKTPDMKKQNRKSWKKNEKDRRNQEKQICWTLAL